MDLGSELEARVTAGTRALLVAAGLALLVAVGLVWRHETPCRPTRARLEALWPEARAATLTARLAETIGDERARTLSSRLTTLTAELRASWEGVCHGTSEDDARRRACLEAQLSLLELVATVVSRPETDVRACGALISRFDDGSSCRTDVPTIEPLPSDPTTRQLVADARLSALSADAARLSGRSDEASSHAARAVELARRSGWSPVEAEALLAQAQVLRRSSSGDAETVLDEAARAAETGRHFEVFARVSVQRVLLATQANRPDEAERWLTRAEAAIDQLHAPRPRLRAEVDTATALLASSQLELDRGLAASERALVWAERSDPVAAADLHAMRALMLLQAGRHLAGLEEARVAFERRGELLGPKHPLTLQAHLTFGEAQARAGLAADAERELTSALDEVRRRSDLDPTNAASGLSSLALALEGRGQPAEALVAATQARELVVSVFGAEHRSAAVAERGVGERLRTMGRTDEAIASLTKAIELGVKAVGAEHPETLESRAALALTLSYAGRPTAREEALAVQAAARAAKKPSSNAQLLAALAIAFAPGATPEERAEAVELARRVRGEPHPDVLRAVLIEAREGAGAVTTEARALFAKLQLVDAALAPLVMPVTDAR